MPGKMLAAVVGIITLSYVILLIVFFFMHQAIIENVNNTNYDVAEVVSTTGKLTNDTYDYLQAQVNRFGDYKIQLKLEKYISEDVYDIYFDESMVIDKYLKVGDRLTIYLEDENLTVFGKLINATVFAFSPDKQRDTYIRSMKTCIVAKKTNALKYGYDIIVDIRNFKDQLRFTASGTSIKVITKLNATGKVYGFAGHPDCITTNLEYGDIADTDEQLGGKNYILEMGEFIKSITWDSSTERLITYTQQ